MGLSIGGTTYKLVTAQARRISGCTLTFFADRDGAQIKSRGGFVKTEITMTNVHRRPADAFGRTAFCSTRISTGRSVITRPLQ